MPRFKHESIQKYPWIYRLDDRALAKRRCKFSGHRYRWFSVYRHEYYLGLCKKCAQHTAYAVELNKEGNLINYRKVTVEMVKEREELNLVSDQEQVDNLWKAMESIRFAQKVA